MLRLHGDDKIAAEQEYMEMYAAIKADVSMRSRRLSDLWATPAMTRRSLVAIGVQVFCQFTGINGTSTRKHIPPGLCLCLLLLVINYFGPSIYNSLGIVGGRALLVQG